MLVTLDKEVYEEYAARAMEDDSRKEADGGIYFAGEGDEGAYIAAIEDQGYVLITSVNKKDIESVVSRFDLKID